MSFVLYLVGALLIIAGIVWALLEAGIALIYIGIICLILLGIGILTGVVRTRPKDTPK